MRWPGTKEAKEMTHFIWQKQEPQEQNWVMSGDWGSKGTKQEAKWWQAKKVRGGGAHHRMSSGPGPQTEVNVSLRNGVTSQNFTDWGIKKDPPGRTQSFFSNVSLPSSVKLTSLNLSSLKGGMLSLRGKMKKVSGYFKACEFPCFVILPPNTKHKTASQETRVSHRETWGYYY